VKPFQFRTSLLPASGVRVNLHHHSIYIHSIK